MPGSELHARWECVATFFLFILNFICTVIGWQQSDVFKHDFVKAEEPVR